MLELAALYWRDFAWTVALLAVALKNGLDTFVGGNGDNYTIRRIGKNPY